MGNKKSTPKQNQEGNTPGQSSAHTKYSPNHAANAREGKQGKKKKERPLSDPSLMSIGDDVTGPNFNQFYLKPSEDIGGKRITVRETATFELIFYTLFTLQAVTSAVTHVW